MTGHARISALSLEAAGTPGGGDVGGRGGCRSKDPLIARADGWRCFCPGRRAFLPSFSPHAATLIRRIRIIATIPSSGPGARKTKAHSQPKRSTSGGIMPIETVVIRNPIHV
jgi:hypothetical protein